MQSGSCSFSRLEMASKRMKTFIFENTEKIQHEKINFLVTVSTKDILASRKARHLCKKKQINLHQKNLQDEFNLVSVAQTV